MNHLLKVAMATAASTLRGWQGMVVTEPAVVQPEKPLKLFEFESCPYCRLVRETLTELALDADIYPCPKGGERFRPEVLELGGKAQFPFLVDDNTGMKLYESADIIEYLYTTYAKRAVPLRVKAALPQAVSSLANSALGLGAGTKVRASTKPEQMLTLYSFEASPFCRPVRETLCELEIPYHLVNLGKEQFADMGVNGVHAAVGEYNPVKGGKREQFMAKTNKMMVPYLEDPNTGKAMFESKAIVQYLLETYGG
ncbi:MULTISPECIES: glutathione S-transferase N-terminal domain-containing protein [unclassified Limnobacter]|uniref:glutathione S-transferase N-terminal domain-containing protein n=1 Tax=unclassified Limnobacter TaxID=2630203 RepID=UPI00031E4901|nr:MULTISPECIES: glutathione S-transferase N-terminal domain-containing protein [unclassified Limnobacter]